MYHHERLDRQGREIYLRMCIDHKYYMNNKTNLQWMARYSVWNSCFENLNTNITAKDILCTLKSFFFCHCTADNLVYSSIFVLTRQMTNFRPASIWNVYGQGYWKIHSYTNTSLLISCCQVVGRLEGSTILLQLLLTFFW